MKLLRLLPLLVILNGCGFTDINEQEYHQVVVTPLPAHEYLTVVDESPVDVTTTRVNYY